MRIQAGKKVDPDVIYEDDSLFILNKPSGWIVNSASTTKDQPVIQKWLQARTFPLSTNAKMRNGIVHRLDKETSGALIVAKTEPAFIALQSRFAARLVSKTYLALVHGKPSLDKGEIAVSVGRLPWNRERFGVLPGGRDAQTSYTLKACYQDSSKQIYSLLELSPKTGRTHQIRIHMKYLGHPLVSDSFYAGIKTSRKDRAWCPRLFLHASAIAFKHPDSAKKMKFIAPLPADLKKALSSLHQI